MTGLVRAASSTLRFVRIARSIDGYDFYANVMGFTYDDREFGTDVAAGA